MTSPRLSRVAFSLFALLLVAVVAGLGSAAFQRKLESFQPLGATFQALPASFLVLAVDDPTTQLVAGDEMLAGGSGDGLPPTLGRLEKLLRADPATLLFVRRGDSLLQVEYRRPGLDVDVPYLLLTAVGLFYLLIGFYTAVKDSKPAARLFFVWCVASAGLFILSPVLPPRDGADRAIFWVDQLARTLLPALTLHLFLVFPGQLTEGRWLRRAVGLVYLPALLLLGFHADQVFFRGRWVGPASARSLHTVDRLELLLLVAFALLAALALGVRLGRRVAWEARRQVQLLLAGLVGGYAPFFLLYVLPATLELRWPEWTAAVAVAPLAFIPLAFAYAIFKYKLWDLGVLLRDAAAYSLTALLGVLGFSLANLGIQRGLETDSSLLRSILTFAAGLLIAGVLVPTKSAISSGLERVQYRRSLGGRRALQELGQDLLLERHLDRLTATLLERLSEGLDVARTHLFLVQGGKLVAVEPRDGQPSELPLDAFGAELWRRQVSTVEPIELPGEEPTPRQRLYQAGYRYAFPLRVRERPIGVVLVGYKYDENPLNSDDVDLVRGLLNQASLALENARLIEEVHHRLDEVVRLKEHNRGILESSPAGIAVLHDDDRILSVNQAFAAIVEVAAPALVDRPLVAVLPIRPLPAVGAGPVEVSYCEPSGRERYLQLSLAEHLGEGGEALRVLVVQEVTERVQMELSLKEREHMASLGMLAAGVAHEVNTPITGISSYAQMLLSDTAEDDPRYAVLKKMERQSFRAAQIVNNLLELSRTRRHELAPVALGAVVTEGAHLLADRVRESGSRIEVEAGDPAWRVLGNEGELHQVVTNLVVNAADAMAPQGGGAIRLRLDATPSHVLLRVEDDGPGIPQERVERVFQPFFSSKLDKGGTGLGLAITHDIVRRHGGTIRVENGAERRGCAFTVELPRHVPAGATAEIQ